MAKVEVETTVTLVMSLEEAVELYETLGDATNACYEMYLALEEALSSEKVLLPQIL